MVPIILPCSIEFSETRVEPLERKEVPRHAAFAAVEAGATGLSTGMSYVLHRFGHHKLERWTSVAHIGLATTGAVRNYSLKTAHPASASAMSTGPSNP